MEDNGTNFAGKAGLAPAEKSFWGPWATTGFGLIILVLSLVVMVFTALIFFVTYLLSNGGFSSAMENLNSSMGAIAAAATILSALICIPLTAAFVRLRQKGSFRDYIGLRRFKVKSLLLWLAASLIFLVVTEVIRYVFSIPQSQNDIELYASSLWSPLFFIAVVVFAPAEEEILFRGFMFQGYSNSRMGPVFAIVITAALWAVLHISVGAYDLAVIFLGGLLFGLARWKTGSLWMTLAMHAFWNFLAFISIALATP